MIGPFIAMVLKQVMIHSHYNVSNMESYCYAIQSEANMEWQFYIFLTQNDTLMHCVEKQIWHNLVYLNSMHCRHEIMLL